MCGSTLTAVQNMMGNMVPAARSCMLNSVFGIWPCATLVQITGAEEGKESTKSLMLCYQGLLRDLKLLAPGCKKSEIQ